MKTKIKIFLIIFFGLFFNQINQTKADFEISQNFKQYDTLSTPYSYITLQSFDRNSLTNSGILNGGFFASFNSYAWLPEFKIFNQNGSIFGNLIYPRTSIPGLSSVHYNTLETKDFVYVFGEVQLRDSYYASVNGRDGFLFVYNKYDKINPYYYKFYLDQQFNGFYFNMGLPFFKFGTDYQSFLTPNLETSQTGSIETFTGQTFTETPNSLITGFWKTYFGGGNDLVFINPDNNTFNDRTFSFVNNNLVFQDQTTALPLAREFYNSYKLSYVDFAFNGGNGKAGMSFVNTIDHTYSSYVFYNGTWLYYPETWIHYYDYYKKYAFAIRNYGNLTNQVPYEFGLFGINTILLYNSGSFGTSNTKYYLKERSNSIWSTDFDPNLDGLSIYTGSILPDGPVNPNYTGSCDYLGVSANTLVLPSGTSKDLHYISGSGSCLTSNLTCTDGSFYAGNILFDPNKILFDDFNYCLTASTVSLGTPPTSGMPAKDQGFFSGLFGSITSGLTTLGNTIGNFFINLGNTIGGFFSNLTTSISNGFTSLGNTLGNFFGGLGDRIGGFFTGLSDSMGSFFGGLGDKIGGFFTGLSTSMGNFFGGLGDRIGGFFTGLSTSMGNFFGGLGDKIGGFFTGLWDSITGLFDFSSKSDEITNSVLSGSHLNDYIGLLTITLPDIPHLSFSIPLLKIESNASISIVEKDVILQPITDKLNKSNIDRSQIGSKFVVFFLSILFISTKLLLFSSIFLLFYLYNKYFYSISSLIFGKTIANANNSGNIFSSAFYIFFIIFQFTTFFALFVYILDIKSILDIASNFLVVYFSFFSVNFGEYLFFKSIVNIFFSGMVTALMVYIPYLLINKFAKVN